MFFRGGYAMHQGYVPLCGFPRLHSLAAGNGENILRDATVGTPVKVTE